MGLFSKKSEDTQENQKVKVYNLIIVDESGSMSSLEWATITGVNETLNTIHKAAQQYSDKQEHLVTLVTFDSTCHKKDVRTIIDAAPIEKVGQFRDYHPCGGTPLYDAVGLSLTRLEKQVKDNKMATAVVTIITDGYENSSSHYTFAQVKALIKRLTAKGWTFAYIGSDHDVEAVAKSLSIDNCMEFSHTEVGSSSSWRRERGSKMKYYRQLDEDYDELSRMSDREREERFAYYNSVYYVGRVTPPRISHLEPHEVFVFGSNIHGNHNGSAAGLAVQRFGAVMGQAEGLQGQSYAIPTTTGFSPLPIAEVAQAVMRFIEFARNHPDTCFMVTAIGCGNAGFMPSEIAPLWREAVALENVTLPMEYWDELGLRM